MVPSPSRRKSRRRIRRAALILLCGVLSFGGSAAVWDLREPAQRQHRIHDEFSYLLAGDTFREGRLANPPHPLGEFFETIHVIQRPTYASKYPPAQGAFLALGSLLGGRPIVGVWLATALFCMALAWALLAWLPERWAAVVSLAAVLLVGTWEYWSQSYWGGSVAALGGALLYGALPEASAEKGREGLAAGLALGAGVVLLALSRPFEGLLAVLPAAAWIVYRLRRSTPARRRRLAGRTLLPAAVLVAAGGAFQLHYNRAVTGDPLTLPYQVHEREYNIAPNLLFLPSRDPPDYRHDALRAYHEEYGGLAERRRDPEHFIENRNRRLDHILLFFLGPLAAGLLALPLLEARGRWVLAAGTCGLVMAGVLLTITAFPHYFAPAAAPLFVLAGAGLAAAERRLGLRRWLLPAVLLASVAWAGTGLWRRLSEPPDDFQQARFAVESVLRRTPGPDLVFVRYGPGHDPGDEWVYNRAVIDSATVVWARDMGTAENRRLVDYYPDRTVWLLCHGESVRMASYRSDDVLFGDCPGARDRR